MTPRVPTGRGIICREPLRTFSRINVYVLKTNSQISSSTDDFLNVVRRAIVRKAMSQLGRVKASIFDRPSTQCPFSCYESCGFQSPLVFIMCLLKCSTLFTAMAYVCPVLASVWRYLAKSFGVCAGDRAIFKRTEQTDLSSFRLVLFVACTFIPK